MLHRTQGKGHKTQDAGPRTWAEVLESEEGLSLKGPLGRLRANEAATRANGVALKNMENQ